MPRKKIRLWVLELFGILLGFVYISPFYFVIINALKSKRNVFLDRLRLPENIHLENFIIAAEKMDYIQAFRNSIIITTLSLFAIVLFSSMAAWVLVRTKTKISQWIFFMFISALLIPFQTVMFPLTFLMGKLDLLNNHLAMVFIYLGFGSSQSIFIYHGFIKSIPRELEDAAIMDGCSHWEVYKMIIFPLLKPISITVAVINGMWMWNDYLLPNLMLHDKAVRTIPLAAKYFFSAFSKDWHLATAALTISIIPVILFYFIAQKHIVKGIIAGSVK